MNLLLDTSVWVELMERPHKVKRAAMNRIERFADSVYLSPISLWEVTQLERKGRLRLRAGSRGWIEEALQARPVREAPLTFEVAQEAARIHLPQPDLGDMMLAATAIAYGLALVTADMQLLEQPWLKTIDAG
ncbi:MAG: type II toxin-antitoxin system VapC family toxin [Bryobacteraceae bacterium]|nr:type II toxin-antitoxin system VapC family toxin [Bryobacteraceae bacterium]